MLNTKGNPKYRGTIINVLYRWKYVSSHKDLTGNFPSGKNRRGKKSVVEQRNVLSKKVFKNQHVSKPVSHLCLSFTSFTSSCSITLIFSSASARQLLQKQN